MFLGLLTFAQSRAYQDQPTLWRDTVRKNPDSWIGHHSLALHYEAVGQLDLALRHADEAIRCKAGSAESFTARAKIHAARGDLEPALRDLDRAIELDPTYPQARLHRADMLLAAKRPAEAAAELDLFLTTNPDYAPALQARGRARVLLGQYEAAVADLDRAIELGAGAAARVDRGSVQAQLGRFDQAREDALEAIRLDDSDPRAYLLQGMVEQLQRGDRDAACAAWARACELGDCRYHEQRCAR
jgi:tetratricopeptide (TPR) repeat protein